MQNIFIFNLDDKLENMFDYCKSKHDCKITFYHYDDFLLFCVYIHIYAMLSFALCMQSLKQYYL